MTSHDSQVICDACRQALAGIRVHMLSLHDHRGEVLFLSDGALGPDEHDLVQESVTRFAAAAATTVVTRELDAERLALVVRATNGEQRFCGLALLVIDTRRLEGVAIEALGARLALPMSNFAASLRPPPVVHRPDDTPTERLRRLSLSLPAPPIAPEVHDLRTLLRRLPFDLYVQRLVALTTSASAARYEVLLRQRSATSLTTAPRDLLRMAVEHGLGNVIDRRVLVALLGWLRQRRASMAAGVGVFSVNLSATSLHDVHFSRFLARVLQTVRLPAGVLAIELQAQLCSQYRGAANALCESLRLLGCPVVLDDFEPSELGLDLLRLPGLTTLKLTPAITLAMRSDAKARDTVAGAVQASRSLGLQTVAKHGDLALDREWLRSLGIDYLQSHEATKPQFLHSLTGRSALRQAPT